MRLPKLPLRARSQGAAGASGQQQQEQKQRAAGTVVVRGGRFAALIPGDGVIETVFTSGLGNFLSLYNAALICRLVLTWFPNPPAQLVGPLSTVTDPYLNLFRGIIPPLGGTIDLSPILAFITLDVFTNSAAALPCELGPDGQMKQPASRQQAWTPAKSMVMWRQRIAAQRMQQQQKRRQA
jgi:YggT family protein